VTVRRPVTAVTFYDKIARPPVTTVVNLPLISMPPESAGAPELTEGGYAW
jgi:hypothetical protein